MWTEERDSLQMAHIPVSGKGPRLVLLWTALPKFPEARSLVFPEFPSLALQFITSSATGFIYSLHLLWHPLLCHPLLPHFPPASDWAPQECITRMGGGEAGREVTHWILSHQLYKVTRGPRKEGQVSSQRGCWGKSTSHSQPGSEQG